MFCKTPHAWLEAKGLNDPGLYLVKLLNALRFSFLVYHHIRQEWMEGVHFALHTSVWFYLISWQSDPDRDIQIHVIGVGRDGVWGDFGPAIQRSWSTCSPSPGKRFGPKWHCQAGTYYILWHYWKPQVKEFFLLYFAPCSAFPPEYWSQELPRKIFSAAFASGVNIIPLKKPGTGLWDVRDGVSLIV